MNHLEFLETGRRLAAGATEGDWRSAVSRGYYAVFHFLRELYRLHGVNVGQGAQAHSNIYVGLNNCGVPVIQALAGRVDQLRGDRTWADYNLAIVFPQARAQDTVKEAEQVINDFRAAFASARANVAIDGARKHLKAIGRIP